MIQNDKEVMKKLIDKMPSKAIANAMFKNNGDFDFTDFNIVRDGKPGPLLDIAKKIQAARGTEDVFVLTARAAEAQTASPAIPRLLVPEVHRYKPSC